MKDWVIKCIKYKNAYNLVYVKNSINTFLLLKLDKEKLDVCRMGFNPRKPLVTEKVLPGSYVRAIAFPFL